MKPTFTGGITLQLMDRNLTERLKKLSLELTDAENKVNHHASDYTDEELQELEGQIADLQDEIWEVEDQILEEAEIEYADHSAKGWN